MIYLKTDDEIEMLRKANLVVAGTLAEVAKWIAPGVTTRRLDQIAEEYIRSQGCTPGFKGLYGYPATLCTSVNEVVVHGIPSNYVLEDGDIVSCDCGAVTPEGFNGDSTYTAAAAHHQGVPLRRHRARRARQPSGGYLQRHPAVL